MYRRIKILSRKQKEDYSSNGDRICTPMKFKIGELKVRNIDRYRIILSESFGDTSAIIEGIIQC